MLRVPEQGCLVIADVSGYTGVLADTELAHAHDALSDLIQTVVSSLRPQFRLAKLEGDAAFAYAVTERIDGSMLLDTFEATYFAFRQRLESISRATTCPCNACVMIPALNLKLLAHHGSFVRERLYGNEELTGRDVIIIHRLLKNTVVEKAGLSGYALFTDACLAAASLDPGTLGLLPHRESYERLGEVIAWVQDLDATWRRMRELRRVRLSDRQTDIRVEGLIVAEPATIWAHVTDPAQRPHWVPGIERVDEETAGSGGRRGIGTTNHCMHGAGVTIEEVLDWRPFEYFTIRSTLPAVGSGLTTYELTPSEGGTLFTIRFERPRSASARAAWDGGIREMIAGMYRQSMAQLPALLSREAGPPVA